VKSTSKDDTDVRPEDAQYTIDILTKCRANKDNSRGKIVQTVPLTEPGEPLVVAVPLSQIDSLSAIRIYIPKDLLSVEARENTLKKVQEVLNRFPDGVQLLDPEDDMQVQSSSYKKAVRRIETLEGLLAKHVVSKSPILQKRLQVLRKKEELTAMVRAARREVRASTSLAFKDELKARKRVLRRLGYATSDDVVELKGKVACEISSADELALTELMFSGVFKDATVEQLVSLLSCFVWQEKLKDRPKIREDLESLLSHLHDIARRIGKVQLECKVQIDVEAYVNSFRPDVMEAVYAWAKGAKFYEVMKITEVFEGSLIRAIRRLEEVLQQLVLASKSVGEVQLELKFQEAITRIKRDIVFAASLYL
jgi:ATP-dependent RNA helicase DOB1